MHTAIFFFEFLISAVVLLLAITVEDVLIPLYPPCPAHLQPPNVLISQFVIKAIFL